MFNLKKNIIKSMIKIDTISNQPGELKLFAKQVMEVDDEYKPYEHFAIQAIKKLDGITDVNVNYNDGIVTILYNNDKVLVDEIYKWIDMLIDITIDNKKFIQDNWENNTQMVWNTLNPILDKQVAGIKNKRH